MLVRTVRTCLAQNKEIDLIYKFQVLLSCLVSGADYTRKRQQIISGDSSDRPFRVLNFARWPRFLELTVEAGQAG